jgi:hypothetical protein
MTTTTTTLTAEKLSTASISSIARFIRSDWKKVYFGAVPYLEAMSTMETIDDNYGCDTGVSIVVYFLSNASGYRGDNAKLIKAELKKRAGIK